MARGKGGRRHETKKAAGGTAPADILLAAESVNEADRRSYIRQWLVSVGVPDSAMREEYHTAAGPIDLYLTNRRVIIEVKKGGRLDGGPDIPGTGSSKEETAMEQLDRYVREERRRERLYLEDDITEQTWLGVVTDARKWYAAEWNPEPSARRDAPSVIDEWYGRELRRGDLDGLASLLNRGAVGKEWASAEMSGTFKGIHEAMSASYSQKRDLRAVRTQKGLWLKQLHAGGNAPSPADADEVFVLHTMLTLIARTISGMRDVRDGFVSWVDDAHVERMGAIIGGYNWRQHTGDPLRSLYETYVRIGHRKLFGEYYTPDWLADMVCHQAIDDGFILEQLKNSRTGKPVMTVLDPCCGSGTFLYHAARRIIDSEPARSSRMDEADLMRFACGMVRGIDIHPVAVEMARANMRRLFPRATENEIAVYQGDSLLTARPEAQLLSSGGEDLPLQSPGGRHMVIPGWFIGSDADIGAFVASASSDEDMPEILGAGRTDREAAELRAAHGRLREIVREEDNGVWKWYISNQAGPMLMRGTVGRIVSNPPWVSLDKIQDVDRKREVKEMARDLNLWVGGKDTRFDLAALFVDRCRTLYIDGPEKRSAWVLIYAAMSSGHWSKLHEKLGGRIGGMWDVGKHAFPKRTCVMYTDIDAGNKEIVKNDGETIRPEQTWRQVQEKARIEDRVNAFEPGRSEWLDKSGKAVALRGAKLIPHCLVWASSVERGSAGGGGRRAGHATVTTKRSTHMPWKRVSPFSGDVPEPWIKKCISGTDVVPFAVASHSNCILPLAAGDWDGARMRNAFWRKASDLFSANRGRGEASAKTLEANLDYYGSLFSQFGGLANNVVYNKAGVEMYAARLASRYTYVADTLYRVPCKSRAEAQYLAAILNAQCMQDAYKSTRRNDMDFAAHVWRDVPIPRYDPRTAAHAKIAALSADIEKTARRMCQSESRAGLRTRLRRRLAAEPSMIKIEKLCQKLLPDHAA